MDKLLPFQGPLSGKDVKKIDESNLSSLQRHHVRLLAHCLFSFQAIKEGSTSRSLPDHEECLKWCLAQSQLVNDHEFRNLILDQFAGAAKQLTELSELKQISPLDLTLDDLLNAHLHGSTF